jgi:Tfp pilus assembly protein FimT
MHHGPMGRVRRWDEVEGWTLTEALVVVAVLSVLAGTGVLAHQAARPMLALASAARQVAFDLRATRMRAIGEATDHRVRFSLAATVYQVQRSNGAGYVDHGPAMALPAGVSIADCTASGGAISFKPRGNAGTFGTVVLRNVRGDTRSVIVNITGRVRMQ